MRNLPTSKKKQKLIDAKRASPLEVGEMIYVKKGSVTSYKTEADEGKEVKCTIESIDDGITVYEGEKRDRRPGNGTYKITTEDIVDRYILPIGANPFEEMTDGIRPIAFTLDSILFALNVLGDKHAAVGGKYDIEGITVMDCNWNPYIYNADGGKEYYQRPFVWKLKEKQLLIESIYQGIDCGKILVRLRGWGENTRLAKAGETELGWRDLVDGKQRLEAVRGFIMDELKDMHGNYFSDLSWASQHRFTNHQLFSYAEMPEETKDIDVIRQFLKLNFAGVPQSKEHIEFVKSLSKRIK